MKPEIAPTSEANLAGYIEDALAKISHLDQGLHQVQEELRASLYAHKLASDPKFQKESAAAIRAVRAGKEFGDRWTPSDPQKVLDEGPQR